MTCCHSCVVSFSAFISAVHGTFLASSSVCIVLVRLAVWGSFTGSSLLWKGPPGRHQKTLHQRNFILCSFIQRDDSRRLPHFLVSSVFIHSDLRRLSFLPFQYFVWVVLYLFGYAFSPSCLLPVVFWRAVSSPIPLLSRWFLRLQCQVFAAVDPGLEYLLLHLKPTRNVPIGA